MPDQRIDRQPNNLLRHERLLRGWSQQDVANQVGTDNYTVNRWECGRTKPSPHFRKRLCELFDKDAYALGLLGEPQDELTLSATTPPTSQRRSNGKKPEIESSLPVSPYWQVPYHRNAFFTGREEILQTLYARLTLMQQVTLTQASALSGLGGIGKTQVAIEYAYRYAQEYSAVIWLAAETTESLIMSLQQIAILLHLPEAQAADQAQMVVAVQQWLATHPGWLLIADNVENFDLLQTVLPPMHQGALLLTTRHQALGALAEPLELPLMSREEGIKLLLHRARRLNTLSSDTTKQQEHPDVSAAVELVHVLEGLPLALDQAGAYIEEAGCRVAEYLQRYHNQRKQALAHRGKHGTTHSDSVVTTLLFSIERVQRDHRAAADLLRQCAFLSSEAIPEELFTSGSTTLGPILDAIVTDPYQFDLALAALRSASLVTRHPETQTLSIHRLVQAVLQDHMEPSEVRLWSERAVSMVNAAFPEPELNMWKQCERYLAPALACVHHMVREENYGRDMGILLFKAGSYLLARGRYGEAESLLEQAVTLKMLHDGPEHQELIPWLERQAELLWRQGKYESVEPLLQRVLALEELHLGSSHAQTAETLNNLALLYWYQGKYAKSEPLFLKALHIMEEQLEHDSLLTGDILINMGNLYRSQGRYSEATTLLERALRAQGDLLGNEHPRLALALDNLAVLHQDQGKYVQAELLLQQALRIQEKHLGNEHYLTALTVTHLANLYCEQREHMKAEPLLAKALYTCEKQLGMKHPYTASVLFVMAQLSQDQEKYLEAEALCQQSLDIWEGQLGTEHPQTAVALISLATLYRQQRRYVEAEALYQRALRIREQVLGLEHPETICALSHLALLYLEQAKIWEANPLYQRALTVSTQRTKPVHPRTMMLLDEYRCLLLRQQKAAEALYAEITGVPEIGGIT